MNVSKALHQCHTEIVFGSLSYIYRNIYMYVQRLAFRECADYLVRSIATTVSFYFSTVVFFCFVFGAAFSLKGRFVLLREECFKPGEKKTKKKQSRCVSGRILCKQIEKRCVCFCTVYVFRNPEVWRQKKL